MIHHIFQSICRLIHSRVLVMGLAAALSGCGAGTSSAGPDAAAGTGPTAPSQLSERRKVVVTSARVYMKGGRPHAYVEGELGDGCTALERVTQQRSGNAITVTFTSLRQGEVCTQIMQLLNAWVALDGPFAPGEYTVRANDVTARFRLVASAGGELRLDPDPGPPPQFPDGPPVPGASDRNELAVPPGSRAVSPSREPLRS
jgi:hypothetical protein